MKLKLYLLCIPLLFLLASCTNSENNLPKAKDGVLVLSNDNFSANNKIPLNGEWEFFWEELLNESDIKERTKKMNPPNINVPSYWEDSVYTAHGYGTYYLKVILPVDKVGNTLAITTVNQGTSYTLTVDGERIAANGYAGNSKETSIPEYSDRLVYFTPRDREINIVLHVSNFTHKFGGAFNPVYIGTPEKVMYSHNIQLATSMFIIGGILIMGVYEIFIYLFRRKEKVFLYFGLINIVIAIYSLFKMPYYYNKIFTEVPWIWGHRIEIISIYLLFLLYLLLGKSMYPKEMKKTPVLIGVIISLVCIVLTLVSQPSFYSSLLEYVFIILGIYMIYNLYVVLLAYRRKRPTALVNLIAIMVFFASVVNDVFASLNFIESLPFVTIGFFFYVLIQSINLSREFALKLNEAEELSFDLKKLNLSLDEKIKDRTEELNQKNEELERLTLLDGLTGIYNRRYFEEHLTIYFEEARLSTKLLAVLMIDVDNFKLYNDQKGHVAGDHLLINLAQLLNDLCIPNSFVARYGGEEFSIVLMDYSVQEIIQFAENVRLAVEEEKYEQSSNSTYITISIGVSSTENHSFVHKEELVKRADQALYASKSNGKNQVTFL
ncbi:diguanylate cyclase (GGDEF) domain-containing protein [Psychrobacillus psychrotolerans]|uniref:Diguanylate cyclase (GGDEF) domain-containing protein n=1 Tax=Psychrobacillus psychrotolerans TaxID=126156 RepID=A0A1I5XKC5_9BACI|nr:diguanylate cyclase [Psychrobacillus psychrotolerans]SFQ32137.1 diguanylate cyclase (GGDEF) domain-containing protein [Psychrobacillus psychrotolerans]